MNCNICGNNTNYLFTAKVLNKYDVKYFECSSCNFVQTETPYWLAEAYASPINNSDVGILKRNQLFSRYTASFIFFCLNREQKYLDFAGGYGVFTRLMRDFGFDFYWNDPYTKNLLAIGFEASIDKNTFELTTAFETFEHLDKPLEMIDKMLSLSKNIVFSTELYTKDKPRDWWYYGFDHGQHVSIYHEKTLMFLAAKFNVHYYRLGQLHFFSAKKISSIQKLLINKCSHPVIFYFLSKKWKSKINEDFKKLINSNHA